MKKHLPPKFVSLFFIYGCLYVVFEVFWRAVSGTEDDQMMSLLRDYFSGAGLVGYTSLWMFVIGGLSGLVLGGLNEINIVWNKLSYFWQAARIALKNFVSWA